MLEVYCYALKKGGGKSVSLKHLRIKSLREN